MFCLFIVVHLGFVLILWVDSFAFFLSLGFDFESNRIELNRIFELNRKWNLNDQDFFLNKVNVSVWLCYIFFQLDSVRVGCVCRVGECVLIFLVIKNSVMRIIRN